MKKHIIYYLFFLSLILFSCKRDFSVPDTSEIQLTIESAEVTEIWLKLKLTPLDTESYYTVLRDTHIVFNVKLGKEDTLLHDKNLEPNHTYKYSVQTKSVTVAKEFITTMDTTSHNFEWQVFEFGDHSSSYFSDVAIINENDILAVGKIYTDSGDFNAAHWNGNRWSLKKIPVKIYNTNSFITGELNAVFAFASNNIYATTGGEVIHYDGMEWGNWTFLFDDISDTTFGGIKKFWGVSDTDFYGVGNKGNIFHYDGQTWQKLNSGMDVNINDIWGVIDGQTGENYIICPASYKYELGEKKLLKINNDFSVTDEIWPYPNRRIHSVWFKNKQKIMICGAGVFTRNMLGIWDEYSELPLIFTNRIRGNDINDIFVVGDFGFLAHFNGLNWYIYKNHTVDLFQSIDFKNNLVINVGRRGKKAVILMMCR